MPFQIIRKDITEVKADAIVNTANPMPVYGSGTDRAVYLAAGPEQLLAERKKIGEIRRGEVAVTPAFQLQATYILHTVGPAWEGGGAGEYDVLTNCYRNCLHKAAELGCTSIAFPLIATGVYGFPKDKALQIAIGEITAFLAHTEMQVILVVFDRESFVLSGRVFDRVEELVEEGVISKKLQREYRRRNKNKPLECYALEADMEALPVEAGGPEPSEGDSVREILMASPNMAAAPKAKMQKEVKSRGTAAIEAIVAQKEQTFREYLFELIDARGMKDSDVYKRANLTRQHFSKIRSNEKYHPKKTTVLALAMAMELNLEETGELLSSAGFALSNRTTFDRLMVYFIESKEYNVAGEINPILFQYNQPLLGA